MTELVFELGEELTRVTARLCLRRRPEARQDAPLVLDGVDLQLVELRLDDRPISLKDYSIDQEGLVIQRVPDAFMLETVVHIRPQDNTSLEGLYRSGSLFCTQCEAEGFRKITFFPDRPDVLSRFTTTLIADPQLYPVLLSNGNCLQRELQADGRQRATWQDPFAKPSYLFALVAGDLGCVEDHFVTAGGRRVALEIHVEKHNLDRCGHAMEALKKALRWEETTYGLEYDLDHYMIVAVDHFNMGAMENKGLNIFNSRYVLARPDTATDADFQAIEEVIAHECLHNWTGNRVTCRDWFQLSLKEGLTVFRDQQFSADQVSGSLKRIDDVAALRAYQFAEDAGPLAHPVRPDRYEEINNFYTATVYEKGAELVRMLWTLLGGKTFIAGVRHYLCRYDGQAVTVEDFLAALSQKSGIELESFLLWYQQAGTPEVTVSSSYQAAEKTLALTFVQQCPATPGQAVKKPLPIPCRIALFGAAGQPLPLVVGHGGRRPVDWEMVLELTQERQTIIFKDLDQPPVASLFRQFSAPVKVRSDASAESRAFLFTHDTDPFNRWDAGQGLAKDILLRGVRCPPEIESDPQRDLLVRGFASVLEEDSLEPSFAARLLTLPDEDELVQQMAEVDVEGLHNSREQLRREIAQRLQDLLLSTWQACREQGPYRYDPPSVGRRSLKNRCLYYLAVSKSGRWASRVVESYESSDNMTDRLAALSLVAEGEHPQRRQLLEDFYRRSSSDPLVIDKWLAVQARSRRPDTLSVVRELLGHPAYSPRNPNRVRALVGSFSRANLLRFHDGDGGGYRLLGEQILQIDPCNPQLAAYLAGGFSAWRRFDGRRRDLMARQLREISERPRLSRDLREVIGKLLMEDPAAEGSEKA